MRACLWAALVPVALLAGCGTMKGGRAWGEDATLRPSQKRWTEALVGAATDPLTWAPLAGAAVLQVDDWDHRASDWAQRTHPVFGSRDDADDWSDQLKGVASVAWYASLLAPPSGDTAGEWMWNKSRAAAVQFGAIEAVGGTTSLLKQATDRTRPDGEDDRSMPSAHASDTMANASLAWRNLDLGNLPDAVTIPAKVGLATTVVGTAWGRVEAGRHYPSDVLVGVGLANFLTRFVNDAFLAPEAGPRLELGVDPATGGVSIGIAIDW